MRYQTALKAFITIAAFGSMASAGNAQFSYSPPVYTPLQSITSDVVNEGIKSFSRSDGGKATFDANTSGRDAALMFYTPQNSRTRTNLQNFVNKSRAVDPAWAEKMEQLFASADIIGQIGSVMANFGLSKNNTADAFALYWIAAWQAAHADTSTPSSVMAQAVAAQAARGLSQSPEFSAANDAQKQELAEALMVQAAMIEATLEAADGDRAQLKEIGTAVKQGAAASGLKLDQMTLTQEGFVEGGPRKGADAAGAMGNQSALASAADSDKTLQYGIMATLGLGAALARPWRGLHDRQRDTKSVIQVSIIVPVEFPLCSSNLENEPRSSAVGLLS